MFRWKLPEDSDRGCAVPGVGLVHEADSGGADEVEFHFAAAHGDGDLELFLDLEVNQVGANAPDLVAEPGGRVRKPAPVNERPADHVLRYRVTVPAETSEVGRSTDDELRFTIRGDGTNPVLPCRVVLRRTCWPIDTALLDRQQKGPALRPQTQAALRWHGWNRYQSLVGLKRFTSGLSGGDVLVFQPLLRQEAGATGGPQAWGSLLLVKTGTQAKIRKEWRNFCDLLADRAHPFMGRCEACLDVLPPGLPAVADPQATLIGSFLGGDLMQITSLRSLVRGPHGVDRCLQVLDRLFDLLAPWYAGGDGRTLGQWDQVFRPGDGDRFILFGKYDWTRKDSPGHPKGRKQYTEALSWDVPFIKEEHLSGHLWGQGPGKGGLLQRLRDEVTVRFSLTHGDLHPENVLTDQNNVWLLDFGATGDRAPTLYDFAKLEVFLRLWCLDLSPAAKELDRGVASFERGLLDVFFGTAGAPETGDELAVMMGARPAVLRKVAACVTWVRRRATRYTLGSPDRRDYLAVLFLTILQTLQHAARERDKLPNYRMLVTLACLLEAMLSRAVGMKEHWRGRESVDYRRLVSAAWLAAPGAPARVLYLMRRPDGRKALPFLAATRGVLQNQVHHLDVFDHTLLVMANLEELLRDPLAALRDPAEFEQRVADSLRRQGVVLPDTRSRPLQTEPPRWDRLEAHHDVIRSFLTTVLDGQSRLLLKWLCLLHDVGKPATRCLQVDAKTGAAKVQFLGHESYSAFLVENSLELWFPDPALRTRLRDLIKNHHFHHQRMDNYLAEPVLEEMRGAMDKGRERGWLKKFHNYLEVGDEGYVPDVPLLLLHGFADVAACAGPESTAGLGPVAEMDLVLLAACATFAARRRP